MNTLKILFIALLLTSLNVLSQNNFNNPNPYSGVNRNIGRSYSAPPQDSPSEIEKNKSQQLDKFMNTLKKELTLDELQTLAIRNEIEKNNKNIDIVIKKETSEDQKSKEISAMMERTDLTINSYLNKEQKEKYKLLKEENNNKKKKKEKNKNKEASKTEE